MAKRTFKAGSTSQTIDIFIQDTTSSTGGGLSGLVFNSLNLKAYYRKGATGAATSIPLVTQTVGGAWSSGGFVEIDATNMTGIYRFDVPDIILTSIPYSILYFYGATNMAPVPVELEIVSYNPFDAVALGLSDVPASISSVGMDQIADAVLDRDMSAGVDSGTANFRTPRQALRFLRNKWTLSGNNLTVYKENDTTASWDSVVTETAGVNPITQNDPA